MAEKNFNNVRIINKHDTEANWLKATNFIPKQGELIVYDKDSTYNYERFKIGDGSTLVSSLPFADANKVDKIAGKGLSTNDYTTAEKNKLSGIAEGANKTVVDTALSASSTNPVQNKVIYTEIEKLNGFIGGSSVAGQIEDAVKDLNQKIDGKSDSDHTHDGRYYTETEVDTKLSGKSDVGHTHSAYVNQNAFSKVVVGSTTIEADNATDTLTLVAGNNVTLTPDASGDKITIAATDTVYTHPTSGVTAGTYRSVTVNAQGHVTAGSNPTTLSGYGITDAATKTELNELSGLVGGSEVATQISEAIKNKSDIGHKHDDDYAAKSHGNHVPTTQTASNKVFLRNDNTWQTITPENIGAATSGHEHTNYASTVTTTGTGNAITVISQSGNTITATKGATFATLDSSGKVPSSQLPSYVDDVVQGYYLNSKFYETNSTSGTVITGESGKIYVDLTSNKTYRWSGSAYVVISETLALGETSSTAYAGDKGKANAAAIADLEEKVGSDTVAKQIDDYVKGLKYAGSSSVGGSATSAAKLDTATAGSATQPVYFADGKPKACTYTLGASVPSDAKFTDTVYTHPTYTAITGKPTSNQTPSFGGTATVSQITSDASGHVTGATDRTITIPSTLSNGTGTAGLIKTTSTVTNNSGYTACPVISGVPYYKDTTYTLSSFGVTATAAELNYVDGATSNIQGQIDTLSEYVGGRSVVEQISDITADDLGIYVQATEPVNAVAGDIWVDTANDPSYIPPTIPAITAADNGKVLMVVNGTLQLVNLNLSIDANGVVSM